MWRLLYRFALQAPPVKAFPVTPVTATSRAAIHGQQRELDGLPGDHESVVSQGIEGHAMGGQHGVPIIAILEVEAEFDFVQRGIGEAERSALAASPQPRAGFHRSRGAGIIPPKALAPACPPPKSPRAR